MFGNPAISERPVALRPDLTIGLPLSENPFRVPPAVRLNWYTDATRAGCGVYRIYQKHVSLLARVKSNECKFTGNYLHSAGYGTCSQEPPQPLSINWRRVSCFLQGRDASRISSNTNIHGGFRA